eukprot:Seg2085.5 transcript_id=Seg2085.5/GoldUCD/mRNA.D3Y31 product="hypothetical protein" protein_id=Seg2085.5/GoldUCD/D3Y31
MAQQGRKKASHSLQMAHQQGEKASTSPNVNRKVKMGCALSSSSVFRKCLHASGYNNPFDTIQEVDEEPTEVKYRNGSKNAEKYEIKEKDMLGLSSPSTNYPNNVSFPISNKKRTFATRNSSRLTTANALSIQLQSLLQKTDCLKDAMNKKRITIQKSLECKAQLTCKLSANKLNQNGPSTISEATPQLHPTTDISLRNPAKTNEPATQNATGHQMKSDTLKMPIDSSSAGGRNRKISWPKKGHSRMTKVSLPNIKLESKPEKDNESKPGKDHASTQENSHAIVTKAESTPLIESKLDTVRAWRMKPIEDLPSSAKENSNYAHLKLKKARAYTYPRSPNAFSTIKQSKQSDEKRTEHRNLEEAKSALTVPLSNNTYLRSRSKSTYKMTAGRIFKIRDMLNIDINEGLSNRGKEVTGDNWNSIKHCRYLRNPIEPEFCTCNMCERCRIEKK